MLTMFTTILKKDKKDIQIPSQDLDLIQKIIDSSYGPELKSKRIGLYLHQYTFSASDLITCISILLGKTRSESLLIIQERLEGICILPLKKSIKLQDNDDLFEFHPLVIEKITNQILLSKEQLKEILTKIRDEKSCLEFKMIKKIKYFMLKDLVDWISSYKKIGKFSSDLFVKRNFIQENLIIPSQEKDVLIYNRNLYRFQDEVIDLILNEKLLEDSIAIFMEGKWIEATAVISSNGTFLSKNKKGKVLFSHRIENLDVITKRQNEICIIFGGIPSRKNSLFFKIHEDGIPEWMNTMKKFCEFVEYNQI